MYTTLLLRETDIWIYSQTTTPYLCLFARHRWLYSSFWTALSSTVSPVSHSESGLARGSVGVGRGEGGRGGGGCVCRSCPRRAERTESPTSPHSWAQRKNVPVVSNSTPSPSAGSAARLESSAATSFIRSRAESLGADASMHFSGKLTTVVLLLLLTAQGKSRCAPSREDASQVVSLGENEIFPLFEFVCTRREKARQKPPDFRWRDTRARSWCRLTLAGRYGKYWTLLSKSSAQVPAA